MTKSTKSRLEARIPVELHETIKTVAEMQQRTVTDFIISAVKDATEKALNEEQILRLSLLDQQTFAQAILSPSPPNEALKKAATLHSSLIE